jgi:HNH endonuclease
MKPVRYGRPKGFPGYKVGTDGSVWSRRKCGPSKELKAKWKRLKPWKLPGRAGNHYLCVSLRRDGRTCHVQIHRLVLETFVGPCPPGMKARHFPDRDTTNNNLDNLSWGTQTENELDKVVHGTSTRKLTASKVRRARKRWHAGETITGIARDFGVAFPTMKKALRGETYKDAIGPKSCTLPTHFRKST